MSDWTYGYVADVGYTYGYYTELNPNRVALAFLNSGLAVPTIAHACELGFGQGMSTNIHAAAGTVGWFGTDFNPSQAAFAQELAAHGAQPRLFDESFDEFCRRPDLPEFDYIGLHGIWSWISDENRQVIVDFIRRKLRVGGVVYISYNTMPGWAAFAPFRELLTTHSEIMSASGVGTVQRIESALGFAEKLLATNPAYARANPQIAERLKRVKDQNRSYLAHEYFNRDWHPMSYERMSKWLEPAKLTFACSANFSDHVEAINLTPEQSALLKEIPDPNFRQTVRDFMINQQFRKDYWVRGARRVAGFEQAEALRAQRFVLAVPRADVSLKVTGALGEASMQEAVYAPILDVFADHEPRALGQVEQQLRGKNINFAQVLQAVMLLAGNNVLCAVQPDAVAAKSKAVTRRLNDFITAQSRTTADLSFLASPITGGGHAVPRFHQLFLTAVRGGHTKPGSMAQHAWAVLAAQGQRILKDGKALESEADNLAELTVQAEGFMAKQYPVLKSLGIA